MLLRFYLSCGSCLHCLEIFIYLVALVSTVWRSLFILWLLSPLFGDLYLSCGSCLHCLEIFIYLVALVSTVWRSLFILWLLSPLFGDLYLSCGSCLHCLEIFHSELHRSNETFKCMQNHVHDNNNRNRVQYLSYSYRFLLYNYLN